jgi:D-tyrosyl-tRNA(Tyr) deacylase
MRLVIQRVSSASVTVEGRIVGEIGAGFLVLVGFGASDGADLPQHKAWGQMLDKLVNLRVFPDEAGKLNRSLLDTGGAVLAVSQFTLYADCRKGRRPSFHLAADAAIGLGLFEAFVAALKEMLPGKVEQGAFGADMDVRLVNAGPVTIILDSEDICPTRKAER